MKRIMIAIAAIVGGTTAAFAQSDGITAQGTNPEGQAYTPPGFNQGLQVYPEARQAPGQKPGMEDYPACTKEVKDRCVQTYTRWTDRN